MIEALERLDEAPGPSALKIAGQIALTGLAVYRASYGSTLGDKIATTLPEERTWEDFAEAAAVAITDFEGKPARRFGWTSRLGAIADFAADQRFVTPPFRELKNNGELSSVHYDSLVIRNRLINLLRAVAWVQGRSGDAAVGSVGKKKTVLQMAVATFAVSPLAQNKDMLRRGAADATALNLISGAGYFINYFAAGKKDHSAQEQEENTTQNSPLRKLVADPVDKAVTFIHEKFPAVQPDHLTIAGTLMVLGAAALAIKNPEKPIRTTALFTAGCVTDIGDGALKRKQIEEGIGEATIDGVLLDSLADRIQEIAIFLALSVIARRRDNDVAADNYLVAAVTSALPAVWRAKAEEQGLIVAEATLGGRVPRAVGAGAGIAFNKNQDATDILSAIAKLNNLLTAGDRRDVVQNGAESPHYRGSDTREKFMREAAIKKKALVRMAMAGAVAGSVVLAAQKLGRNSKTPKLSKSPRRLSPAQIG
ncbi:MAG TPA: CDP-alcohol phosphatidyltransferase family protein [Candidatus Saccharimonadales bacterium]